MITYDCLVTKLVATVNNDNLPKFDILKGYYKKPSSGNALIKVKAGEMVIITNEYGEQFTVNGNGAAQVYAFDIEAGESCKIEISNILSVIDFSSGSNSAYTGYKLEDFWPYRTDTTDFANMCPLSSGSIESLGELTSLISLNFSGANAITGEITVLAEKQVENGRTSGVLNIYYTKNSTSITYNGSRPTGNPATIRFGTSMENPTETDTANGYQVVMG